MKVNKKMIIVIGCIMVIFLAAGVVIYGNIHNKLNFLNSADGESLYVADTTNKNGDLQTDADNIRNQEEKNGDTENISGSDAINVINQTEEEFTVPEVEIKQDSEGTGDSAPVTVNTDGTVDVKKIEGFESEDGKQSNVSEARIRIDSVGSYSGPYVEDGSNEPVKDVLSIVVTNVSDQFLQYSQITMKNGAQEAAFELSNLPAGASALVLEAERSESGGTWEYKDDTSAFIAESDMHQELFSWKGGDYTLILTNKSENNYGKVYVYYKNTQDGIYIGGITYRISFEDVVAGATITQQSKHFYGSSSHVMMIDYIDN